jgi:2-polyprenyl-3-methyl-5-hydroxy-6-metoxy-1,4-benzoquinol methylase
MYQDRWLNGRAMERGQRECAQRYTLVRDFADATFGARPFTVCDIGANWCYFGLRLAEDFPACTVIAWEFHDFARKAAHVKANHAPRVRLYRCKLTLDDIAALATCSRFDLVLALSVCHHLAGSEMDWVTALRRIGRHVLLERAVTDSRVRGRERALPLEYAARLLGHGESHIHRGERRPILAITGVGP